MRNFTHWILVTFVFCWQETSPFWGHSLQKPFQSNPDIKSPSCCLHLWISVLSLSLGFNAYWNSLCKCCSEPVWMKAFYQFKLDWIGLWLWHRQAPTWSVSGSHISTCQPSRGSDSSASEPGLSSPLESIHPDFEFIPKLFFIAFCLEGILKAGVMKSNGKGIQTAACTLHTSPPLPRLSHFPYNCWIYLSRICAI